jgi:hypothetical protein
MKTGRLLRAVNYGNHWALSAKGSILPVKLGCSEPMRAERPAAAGQSNGMRLGYFLRASCRGPAAPGSSAFASKGSPCL